MRWAAEDEIAILDCLSSGMTLDEAAEHVGRTLWAVLKRMQGRPRFKAAVSKLLSASGKPGQRRPTTGRFPRRPWTVEDKQSVIRAIEADGQILKAVRASGRSLGAFYALRHQDPAFDAAVVRACDRAGKRSTVARVGVHHRNDPETVRQRILEALRKGMSLNEAIKASGVSTACVYALRHDDPAFDHEVVAAAALRKTPTRLPRLISRPDACYICQGPLHARGLCAMHYHRWRRTGMTGSADSTYGRKTCQTPGCGKPHRAKGYCIGCYDRHHRNDGLDTSPAPKS